VTTFRKGLHRTGNKTLRATLLGCIAGTLMLASTTIPTTAQAAQANAPSPIVTPRNLLEQIALDQQGIAPHHSSVGPSVAGSVFYGGYALSSKDAWGFGFSGGLASSEHWDGSTWQVVVTPSPPGAGFASLCAASGVASDDLWAVGFSDDRPNVPYAEHWDGSAWTLVYMDAIPNARYTTLYSIQALATNDVWAVGYDTVGAANSYQTLVEHWDGNAWTRIPSPNGPSLGSLLSGISGTSSNDLWAVGSQGWRTAKATTLIEHWNGSKWRVVASPNLHTKRSLIMGEMTAVSDKNIWAVGFYTSDYVQAKPLVLHYDGVSWSIVKCPNPGPFGSWLLGHPVALDDNTIAVGGQSTIPGVGSRAVTMIYNGSEWQILKPRNPEPNSLFNDLSSMSGKKLLATGATVTNSGVAGTLAEVWNGHSWKVLPS
jgi:hypothetical protein